MDAVKYRNGQKNRWRHSVWCQLRRRPLDFASGICLYLPGEEDLDRENARRCGLPTHNMIAVERDPAVVKRLRARGTTCIEGSLADVMLAWQSAVPVRTVIADLQCGLTAEAQNVMCTWAVGAPFRGGTLVLNVQRGRETGDSNEFNRACRVEIDKIVAKHPLNGSMCPASHRGAAAMAQLFCMLDTVAIDLGYTLSKQAEFHRRLNARLGSYLFPGYVSNRVVMDSVMFHDDGAIPFCVTFTGADARLTRRIRAALAVATMRARETENCLAVLK